MCAGKVTVSICEDNRYFANSVEQALLQHDWIEIAGIYYSGEEALKWLPVHRPDVVLMDISLPGMNGIECVYKLRECFPSDPPRVLMLTGAENAEQLFQSIQAGACGYLLKSQIDVNELGAKIREACNGGVPTTPTIARQILAYFRNLPMAGAGDSAKELASLEKLTPRETEVLQSVAQGFLNKEIQGRLDISMDTVRKHTSAIYRKLEVRTRTEAATLYMRHHRTPGHESQ